MVTLTGGFVRFWEIFRILDFQWQLSFTHFFVAGTSHFMANAIPGLTDSPGTSLSSRGAASRRKHANSLLSLATAICDSTSHAHNLRKNLGKPRYFVFRFVSLFTAFHCTQHEPLTPNRLLRRPSDPVGRR